MVVKLVYDDNNLAALIGLMSKIEVVLSKESAVVVVGWELNLSLDFSVEVIQMYHPTLFQLVVAQSTWIHSCTITVTWRQCKVLVKDRGWSKQDNWSYTRGDLNVKVWVLGILWGRYSQRDTMSSGSEWQTRTRVKGFRWRMSLTDFKVDEVGQGQWCHQMDEFLMRER